MRHRFHGREILFRKRTRMFHLSNKSTPLVLAVFLQAKFAILQIAASGQLYLIVCTLNCHRRFNSIHTMSPYIDIYTRYPTRGIWALSWHPRFFLCLLLSIIVLKGWTLVIFSPPSNYSYYFLFYRGGCLSSAVSDSCEIVV